MTLDEAIKHAEEVAEEKDMQAGFDTDYLCYQMSDAERNQCKECASEHRQLAEWLKDYKRLLEQEPCADAISRQAVLDAIAANCIWENEYNLTSSRIKKAVEGLPPVTPPSKTGHWIEDLSEYDNKYPKHIQALWKCVECKEKQIRKSNYCPGCGAKMIKQQESEDKE